MNNKSKKAIEFTAEEFQKIAEIVETFLKRGISENPPKFIIFMGGVGVGKTTIRKQKYDNGYVHFEFGEIYTAVKKIVGKDDPRLNGFTVLASDLILQESIHSKKNIVAEIIGDNAAMITPVIDKMEKIGYKISIQMVTADIVESRKRHLKAVEEDKDYISAYFTQEATLSAFYNQLGLVA